MDTRVCTYCGITFNRKPGWSRPLFARTKYCSLSCSTKGRWLGADGEAYRVRLGAARRAFNVKHPDANRARMAKTAAAQGHQFPSPHVRHSGRTAAAQLVMLDKCVDCGRTYNGPRSLHRHHANGNPTDNRLGNIVVLCLKCHAARHALLGFGFGYEQPKTVMPRPCAQCGTTIETSHDERRYCSQKCYHDARWSRTA